MKKILVTGSKGQLGHELRKSLPEKDEIDIRLVDIDELNLILHHEVATFIDSYQPDIVINCAAYTAVDKAEEEPELSFEINAKAPRTLAEACAKHKAWLIHVSTDYVFGGQSNRPIDEEAPTKPNTQYGKSKLAGEKFIASHSKSIILRTSWLYSAHGSNFVKTMIKYGNERDVLNVVYDQIGTPTFAGDLAEAIAEICEKILSGEPIPNGIYHYSNEGVCSWYDFAKAIMEIKGIKCMVEPIETKDYPLPAPRPFYSVMNKAKFKNTFKIAIPHWRDSLRKMLSEL